MDAVHEIPSGPPADAERVARFRRRATPVIAVLIVLFAIGSFFYPKLFPEQTGPDMNRIIGETYTNVYLYFGAPQREESDGQGGAKLHYDEFQVVGDHFEKREFRIYVNTDGRVYKFERD